MDIKDIDNLSKRDSPGWMASVVVHIGIIVMMMVIYVPVPEELNPIQIIMNPSAKDDEDSIIMDDEPYVNQEMIDWLAEIEAEQEELREENAKTAARVKEVEAESVVHQEWFAQEQAARASEKQKLRTANLQLRAKEEELIKVKQELAKLEEARAGADRDDQSARQWEKLEKLVDQSSKLEEDGRRQSNREAWGTPSPSPF